MKADLKLLSIISCVIVFFVLNGCSKSDQIKPDLQQPAGQQTSNLPVTADGRHAYGLLPMTPDQYANIPKYSAAAFQSQFREFGAVRAAIPPIFTLATPAVRDQGTLGSCTSFCGA